MPGDTATEAGVNQSRTTEVVEKIKITASCERDIIQLAVS
jgi:hypothetical protein